MAEVDQNVEKEKFEKIASEVVSGLAPAVPPTFVLKGRRKIMTNYLNADQVKDGMNGYEILTPENMHEALTEAMKVHVNNAREIKFLMDYYKGEQSILNRVKEVREDVDNKVVINYASSFTRDIMGYTFGKPMQYIARRSDDENDIDNPIKEELRLLSDYSELADKAASDQEKATDASICGISHRGVFMNKNYEEEDESPFSYMNLDSSKTFVAYSSQLGNKEVFACTYISSPSDSEEQYTIYTVYTTDKIYQYKTPFYSNIIMKENLLPGYPMDNPLGICIVENENNQFRMGHWETALTLMDAINKIASDSVNDVEQFVNAILVAINAEFTEETMISVRENKFAQIMSPQGMPADLKYIQQQLDGASVEQLRQYLEDCLRVVVGIPDRKTRGGGGGDTGDAVKLRDGWADMEIVARTTEIFNKKSEKKELRIILKILKTLGLATKLRMINIDLKYPRNKTDNLSTKVQAMAGLHNLKIMAPEDTLEIGDITTDIAEVVQRGEAYWKQKNEEAFEEQRKLLMQKEVSGADDETQKGDGNNGKQQSADNNTGNSAGNTDRLKPAGKSADNK